MKKNLYVNVKSQEETGNWENLVIAAGDDDVRGALGD
jgi:hypothetical protein